MHITDGIILRKEPHGEAGCLVTALTSDFAKIRLVAQGVRKSGAKLKGHLEPLSRSRLSFVAGRNGYRLVGAELLDFFRVIKNDPSRFRLAAEIIRMFDGAIFEDDSGHNSEFLGLGREVFKALDDPARSIAECAKAFLWFKIRFLKELGLLPDSVPEPGSCADFISDCSAESLLALEGSLRPHFAEHLPENTPRMYTGKDGTS